MNMRRTDAVDLLDRIRVALAQSEPDGAARTVEHVKNLFQAAGVPDLVACQGDAHSNPHIDNCGACMPRWGWVGARVRIT